MKEEIAEILLKKGAVTLNTKEPYTYVSGIRSPIYCDNRIMTFFPEERKKIVQGYVEIIKDLDPEVVVGTASSAISWAAWISETLGKPMAYIRKKSKGYGQTKRVEGGDINGKKVVVVEDLVSTGGSSFNAVQGCRDEGAEVLGMVAIFTYEFEKSKKLFDEGDCKDYYLTDFTTLVEVAENGGFLETENIEMVKEWSSDPKGWGPKYGFDLGEDRTQV